ncbi:MAG: OmpA family protein [Saprospiraceae bacterium]|nr:OmpA family protein [Saprospiraceae bacterium]
MKKLTLSVLAVLFTATVAFAQLEKVDNVTPNEDQVPQSRMDQHEAFLDGEYRFPAKPRNMWALGIEGGYAQVSGDVNPEFGYNVGASLRKALGYATSLRLRYDYQRPEGEDYSVSQMNTSNSTQRVGTTDLAGGLHFDNFEATIHQATLELVLNLNNINFHREQNRWNLDLSLGGGGILYDTETTLMAAPGNTNAALAAANGTVFNYNDPRDTRRGGLEGDYVFTPVATAAAGLNYRASDRLAIGLEPRYTRTWVDWIDTEAYDDPTDSFADNDFSSDKDQLFTTNAKLEFALGNKDKRVQPLWWENPLNFAYPHLTDEYSFDPDYLFDDADGDGVIDRLDKEPNSPCTFVDGSGVVIDSDKDGVADCVDACPFTPAAQRADIDENGCTEIIDKHCCDEVEELRKEFEDHRTHPIGNPDPCANMAYPSVNFTKGSKRLVAAENAKIQSIASMLAGNPSCRVVIEGFATGSRKVGQQMAYARAQAVANALVDTYGISRDRIIVRYSSVDGFGDVVNVRSARPGEYGSANPAAPFPGGGN